MIEDTLRQALAAVEIPTLGHFLEDGFCAPRIRRIAPAARLCGTARTVDLAVPDAIAVNRALLAAAPGEVLVIRVAGARHAPVGAVTGAAALARGVVGIVVDGPVTDVSALGDIGIPVYSDGTSALTTKLLGADEAALGGPVQIGGVTVHDGDLVLGDENGLLIVRPYVLTPEMVARARDSDDAEPTLLARISAGEPLETLLNLIAPTPAPPGTTLPKEPLE